MLSHREDELVIGKPLRTGMRVGLLGGSFDPAHDGHLHISHQALRRFDLDRLVWLVSPGNPLKKTPPAAIAKRISAAQSLIQHPCIMVSDYEARIGTRYSAQTLQRLTTGWPDVRFVWLMGADNLAQFHRWENWRAIMSMMPIGILARPGKRTAARTSPASKIYQSARLSGRASQQLPLMRAPAWCFVNMPMSDLSSSAIRASGQWPSGRS